jgi:hypothetical protein
MISEFEIPRETTRGNINSSRVQSTLSVLIITRFIMIVYQIENNPWCVLLELSHENFKLYQALRWVL